MDDVAGNICQAQPFGPPPSGGGGGGGGGSSTGSKSSGSSGMKSPGKVKEGSAYQTETRKIILSLGKVRKVTPNGKELIRNINLGMYLAGPYTPPLISAT